MANWTRNELLLALNLYLETPFGKQHKGHPPIIALAKKIGRTPSSVAMKLNNLTSLDPIEQARGIKGLPATSKLDREVWNEFNENKEALVFEIEGLLNEKLDNQVISENEFGDLGQKTEILKSAKVRRHQNFFRRIVLGCYNARCCLTGNPIPELLRASHIVPWSHSKEHRLNPRNGLCLVATFDAAFDRGLISLDDSYRLMLTPAVLEYKHVEEIRQVFMKREGKEIELPEKNLPDLEFVRWHRQEVAGMKC